MVLNGVCVFGLAYSGCNLIFAVVLFTLSLGLHGAVSTGALSSMVDIGPNYAGITMGIVSTISNIPAFISPIIVGYLTFENQNISAWQNIFEICAVMLIVCGLTYIWLNDTSIQEWNNTTKPVEYPKELMPLYSGKTDNEANKNKMEKTEKDEES